MSRNSSLAPGSTIGILGGGPLGRQIALAARTLGFRARVLETLGHPAAAGLADFRHAAHRLDTRAAAEITRGCDVVTASVEDVAEEILESAAANAPLRPGMQALRMAQDRRREHEWMEQAGIPIAKWRPASTREELASAMKLIGGPCVVKPAVRRTPDVRPLTFSGPGDAQAAWIALRGVPAIVEAVVPVNMEVNVLVARGLDGSVRAYPAVATARHHMREAWSVLPAPVPRATASRIRDLATNVARQLDVIGLLAVEVFLLRDGSMVVNEFVPGPHPAFLGTDAGCATGQCEQLVRAITGLPLGSTALVQPTASGSVIATSGVTAAHLQRVFGLAGVSAQAYDAPPIEGRPLGHVTATGSTPDEALWRLNEAQVAIECARERTLARLLRRMRTAAGHLVRRAARPANSH